MKHVLTAEILASIETSVLCWLATSSSDGMPNVSPKEIFTYFDDDTIIIANIASPQSVNNIRVNECVCISFIDILVQKGYQLKGTATVVDSGSDRYSAMEAPLLKMTGGNFPFSSIIEVKVERAKQIIAPRYMLYPETTEAEQILAAKKMYGL